MHELFLLRHGTPLFDQDGDGDLSSEGIRDAKELGMIIHQALKDAWLVIDDMEPEERKNIEDYQQSYFALHSGTKRTHQTLKHVLEQVSMTYTHEALKGFNRSISRNIDDPKPIIDVVDAFGSRSVGIVVAHNWGVGGAANHYNELFDKTERFDETPMGGGYYVSFPSKKVVRIGTQ